MEKMRYDRTVMLVGQEGFERLRAAKVLVFGIGGVGGYAVEALARTGIGTLGLVDDDTVDITNLNRQIIALETTMGQPKVEAMKERIGAVDPETRVLAYHKRLTAETLDSFDLASWDYVVDAIDDVAAKVFLAEAAAKMGVPLIASMGTGNKLDPSKLRVADISKTHTCPLAKKVRKELRDRGINHLKVVFSDELPYRTGGVSSVAFVPGAAGLLIASEVVKDLLATE